MIPDRRIADLKATMPSRVISGWQGREVPRDKFYNDCLTVCVGGGLGDAILSVGPIKRLVQECGDVVIRTHYPDLLGKLTGQPAKDLDDWRGADYWLFLNSIARFDFAAGFGGFPSPQLEARFKTCVEISQRREWAPLIHYHPFGDNILGREAVKRGLNRRTLPYFLLGYEPPAEVEMLQLSGPTIFARGPHITVHDGIDVRQPKMARATKTWELESWMRLVKVIKNEYPEYTIAQIGAKHSRRIEGTTDHRGFTNEYEAMQFVSGASLHIDGDSGLTHAAAHLGVPAAALFGPTNDKFFAYGKTRVIRGEGCAGDCWWLKKEWNQECPIGNKTPVCMDSISVESVMREVRDVLR